MPSYKAPVRDMQFLLHEVWNASEFCQKFPALNHVDQDLMDSILNEAAKLNENILQPLNQSGDKEGCRFDNGQVYTPKGFKEAYQQVVEGGWLSLTASPEFGGQGLPKLLQVNLDEMLASSNVSFSLYCVLTQGAVHALELHGTEEMKNTYLSKLVSGEWGGTMCLTEPHCGTDLSLVKTKAELQKDGSYKLTGTKIFITSGEHDLTDNIVHTVLARTTDAPDGIKGISLFLVPKFLVQSDGSLGQRNSVHCGAIEHKMGIRGSATCVMNFDGATGYLMAEKNQGMRAMFDMMNLERINIGVEGLGLAEVSYQNALQYAQERLQGRAASQIKYPEKSADPLTVHPDIRRMLLTMKANNEAARALLIWTGMQTDILHFSKNENEKEQADHYVTLLTPVIKAYFSDYGFEACNLGLQILGGHGYIQEWGMEQFVRDARIAQIYEGANGIQALDLVKRKVVMNQGQTVKIFAEMLSQFINEASKNPYMLEFIKPLQVAVSNWLKTTEWLIEKASTNKDEMGASSVDYLKLTALICFAWMWAHMVKVAWPKKENHEFYAAKVKTAQFFYQRLFPEWQFLQAKIHSGAQNLMQFHDNEF